MSQTLSATAHAPLALPAILPIFPLPNVVLLPRARLPLHVFEPRYLAMVDDVLATQHRMIGMIQPSGDVEKDVDNKSPVYGVGCAGRITSFAETEDGRLMIGLTGVCRFEIGVELKQKSPYRQVQPLWEKFLEDREEPGDVEIDHARFAEALKPYFKSQSIEADWEAIENMEPEMLVSTLAMICPFASNEKQALLEAPDLKKRASMLLTLLEMAAAPSSDGGAKH